MSTRYCSFDVAACESAAAFVDEYVATSFVWRRECERILSAYRRDLQCACTCVPVRIFFVAFAATVCYAAGIVGQSGVHVPT